MNPSHETRFGGPRGNKPGRPKGSVSIRTRLRNAFDVEAPIKDKAPGHGITYLDLMIESIRRQAVKGNFQFVGLAFEKLENDALEAELDRLRGMVDVDEPNGDVEGDQAAPGEGGDEQVPWRD